MGRRRRRRTRRTAGKWPSTWPCSARTACAQGDQGWWDDWAAALSPWGCDVRQIRVPVQLWHGENDRAVPVGHGRWLAANVPGIDAHITGDDHSTIDDAHRDETYAWLARHA